MSTYPIPTDIAAGQLHVRRHAMLDPGTRADDMLAVAGALIENNHTVIIAALDTGPLTARAAEHEHLRYVDAASVLEITAAIYNLWATNPERHPALIIADSGLTASTVRVEPGATTSDTFTSWAAGIRDATTSNLCLYIALDYGEYTGTTHRAQETTVVMCVGTNPPVPGETRDRPEGRLAASIAASIIQLDRDGDQLIVTPVKGDYAGPSHTLERSTTR